MAKVKLLSRADVEKLLTMEEAISSLESAFAELSQGRAEMPQRTPIRNADATGVVLFMPAFIPRLSALGTKVVSVFNDNPAKHNLPAVQGIVVLINPENGSPLAIMDASYLTAVRTGAVSGVATKFLAREDAQTHVLLGSGVQAKTQAWAVATVRKLKECLVYSIDPEEKKIAFCADVESLTGVRTTVAEDAEGAVRKADILTLATSAREPIINGDWIKPGTHINGIGSHAPSMREIDADTLRRSKVICDSLRACQAEAGDLIIPAEEGKWDWRKVYAELGQLITGELVGRENDDEITLFKSVGLAIQDMSTAALVYGKASENGLGVDFEL